MTLLPSTIDELTSRVTATGEVRWRRLWAVRQLARSGQPDAVRALAEAMPRVDDAAVRTAARRELARLRRPG